MSKSTLLAGLTATLAMALPVATAHALTESFVLSTGNDANPCTRSSPCQTFLRALAVTDNGGTIWCLDSGPYTGNVNTGLTVTIDCNGGVFTPTSGSLGTDGNMTLRNMVVSGVTGVQNTLHVLGSGKLTVENCIIQDASISNSAGIAFAPNALNAQLVVRNTTFQRNGSGVTGGAIVIRPQAGGGGVVSLDNVTVANNVFGIAVDGSGSTAGIGVVIANSNVHRNSQDGIVATTTPGGAPIGVMVRNTRSINNSFGARSIGAAATIRMDSSTVMHNSTGLAVSSGGALLSFGNNHVVANGVNGAFTGSLPLQ